MQAIPPSLEGNDILATAQTGTDKTLAFLIPLIELLSREPLRRVNGLVLLPTCELAMQVNEEYEILRTKPLPKAALVIGGVLEIGQMRALRLAGHLATPGRLEDFLDRKVADLRHVKLLVLDGADRMLDIGFLLPSGAFFRACQKVGRHYVSRPPWSTPSPGLRMSTCANPCG